MNAFSRLVLACLSYMTLALDGMAAPAVWIAMSGEGGALAEAEQALVRELGASAGASAPWKPLLDERGQRPPGLIVTVGTAALNGVLERLAAKDASWSNVTVLATMVPRASHAARQASPGAARRTVSAVVLDQPAARQMALIKRALPHLTRVGILPGEQTRTQLDALQREARARELKLVAAPTITTQEAIYPALRDLTEEAQVILAQPDPVVFNPTTLQNILLVTYRARIPLVAFSPAYTRAGAMLSLHSTPTQIAEQTSEVVRDWLAGGQLPEAQSPRAFTVSANRKVAASLGLSLDDEEKIAADLLRLETGR